MVPPAWQHLFRLGHAQRVRGLTLLAQFLTRPSSVALQWRTIRCCSVVVRDDSELPQVSRILTPLAERR